MKNNAITVNAGNSANAGVPAYLDDAFGSETNIQERASVPTLSYEGKTWTINLNGERTKITRTNDDGDVEPVQVLRVVIVDYSKHRGRTYYEGSYEPGRALAPLCWSDDNIMPHPSIAAPQAKRCDQCPQSVKGSRITDQNKQTTACAQHKLIAVVPAFNLDHPPLRLKLAITSVYDKNNPEQNEQNWFAFDQYLEHLRKRQIKHTAAVVTKVKFDPSAPWPKLLFACDRWLEAEEVPQVKKSMTLPEVKQLLVGSWAGAHTGMAGDHALPVQQMIPPPPTPKPAATPDKPVTVEAKAEVKAEVKKDKSKPAKGGAEGLASLLKDWHE